MDDSTELTPADARKLIDRVVRDHKRIELERDRLGGCTKIGDVRRVLVEAGIPRQDIERTLDAERRRIARRRKSRRRRPYLIALAVIVLGVVGFYGAKWVAPRYDALVMQREDVRREWAQIDALLQRRYDLIPNLVETVGGVAGHEATVLTDIAAAHSGFVSARSSAQRLEASYRAERAIRTCARLSLHYPQLKSDRAFLRLMEELTRTEDRITTQRMKYNDAVATLNAGLQTVDGRIVALVTGIDQAPYYNPPAETETLPSFSFSNSTATVDQPPPAAAPPSPDEPLPPEAAPAVVTPSAGPADALENVVVKAIGGSRHRRAAFLDLPDGTRKRVLLGDRLDPYNARVVAINPDSVLLETTRKSTAGNTVKETIRLPLHPR